MFKIAFRNVLRNGRRSLMTGLAVAVGAIALVLVGEYNGMIKVGIETGVVQGMGHLAVYKKGYFAFGSARPSDYSISGYRDIAAAIRNDAVLKRMLNVVTPRVALGGIAGNAALDKSKTFFGSGFVPSDQDEMLAWDEYNLRGNAKPGVSGLKDAATDHGIVGRGLARILGLCKPLKLKDCPATASAAIAKPKLELLSGSSGAPNIVAFYPDEARGQGAKELDDSYVGMNLALAQQLVFGGGEHKVSSIAIQLKKSEDIAAAKARLNALFAEKKLDLEVKDLHEVEPSMDQIIGYMQTFFVFVGLILGIIVLFTVANTMSMSVMERTNEIGTARAMGVRRSGIHRQFMLEGAILGVLGATGGLVLAHLATYVINRADIRYTPPGNAASVQLYLLSHGIEGLLFGVWLALVLIATLATIVPANKAASMKVVDALRHV